MHAVVEQRELFPVIAENTPMRSLLWRYVQLTVEHGALLPISLAAEALKVSRQRVYQLLDGGQLPVVLIGDRKFIPAAALELFMTEDRKTGVHLSRRWIYLGEGPAEKKR